jgi:putative ABC transport system permease protein
LQKLKENSAIENVALSSQLIGGSDAFNTRYYIFNSDTLYFNSINCTSEILDVFDIPLIDGDGFVGIRDSEVSNYDYKNDCVVSAEIFSKFKYNIGDTIYGMFGAIRGVIDKGLRITSFRKEIMPLALGLAHAEYLNFCYVKIAKGSNLKTALTHIENVVSEIVPEMPLEITFYDKIFENLYKKEINTSATTVFMAILALLISIFGVFGMVTFDSEYRHNEIALRRVFGASTDDIIKKINAKYLIMIFAGFVLSLPVTLYVITLWQQNFVEKAPLPWWMFPVVVLLVTVVTCAIVTVQSAKTVYGNPVEGLKKE